MPELDRSDATRELALDRYWDAVLTNADDDPLLRGVEPDLAATVRRARDLDIVPSPHPAFTSTLWGDLMHASAGSLAPPRSAHSSPGLPVRPAAPVDRRFRQRLPDAFSHIAAAILLVALLAGSAYIALYQYFPGPGAGLPLFAPEATTTVNPALPAETTLLDLTLPDLPAAHIEGGLAITDYPPGGGSQERAATSTEVFYIAVGPMRMTAVKAPQPVQVIPPSASAPDPSAQLSEGQTTTLATGTTVIAPPGAVLELLNTGTSPTRMFDLLWVTASASSERDGAEWWKGFGGIAQDIESPVRVTVRRVMLAPDATYAAPDAANTVQSANVTDLGRLLDLRFKPDGSVRNAGDEPVDVYVLTVTSQAALPAPDATGSAFASGDLEFLWESAGGPDPLVHPYGVAVDPEGYVWVSDGKNDRFQLFAPDGTFLETWGVSGSAEGQFDFHATHGVSTYDYGDVAFDGDGNLYVADTGNFRVQKFAPDRSFLQAWGTEGKGEGQFMAPGGIAVAPDGSIYVTDESRADVQWFTADGTYRGSIGGVGVAEGQFIQPAGVAIGRDGHVWVADYGNNRIQEFDSDGQFLAAWGSLGSDDGELNSPNDVTVDRLGRVIVADMNNNRLQVFAPDGRFLANIGTWGTTEPGQFSTPNGLAVDEHGVIYVADNVRVQAFRLVIPQGGALSS